MKKSVILIIAIISLLVVGCSSQNMVKGKFETIEGAVVTISGFAFNPAEIKVNAGSKVTWINEDSVPHTIMVDAITSEKMNTGGKFEHTFDTPGEYDYLCTIHTSMKGKVIVQ